MVGAWAILGGRPSSDLVGEVSALDRAVRIAGLLAGLGCARQTYFAQMGLSLGACASSGTGCHTSRRMTTKFSLVLDGQWFPPLAVRVSVTVRLNFRP